MSRPNNRHRMGTPGVPMLYQPAKLDRTFSNELAARLAREYTEECIEILAEHARNTFNPQVSLAAANALLDRAYGKPKELKEFGARGANGETVPFKVEIEFVDPRDKRPEPVTIDQDSFKPDFVE